MLTSDADDPDLDSIHANLARSLSLRLDQVVLQREALTATVRVARAEKMSWAQIAMATGMSRQAAWAKWSKPWEDHPNWEDQPLPGLE